MSDIKIVRYWDSMPPTVYADPAPGAEAFSTRVLERQWRIMASTLERIVRYGDEDGKLADAALTEILDTQKSPK